MRKLMLLILGLVACGSAWAQAGVDYKALFWKQIKGSCQGTVVWHKEVTDLSSGVTEAREFRIDCGTGRVTDAKTGAGTQLPSEEFSYLFEHNFADPYVEPMMVIKWEGQSVYAVVQGDKSKDTPLQRQNFEVDARGVMRAAEVAIRKENTLYTLEVSIRVWFDEAGRYAGHTTSTLSDVFMGGDVKTKIQGKLLP